MTKTQANEPGFVLVPAGFLDFLKHAPVSSGVCCCGDEIDKHSDPMSCGHSPVDMWDHELEGWLNQIAAAPIVPAPAYGVKALEALEPFAAIGRWLNADWQDDSTDWPGSVSECENAPPMPTVADLRRSRTVYEALSSAPVEEADAKAIDELGTAAEWKAKREELLEWTGSAWLAGETDDDHRSELYGFLCGLIGWMRSAEEAARVLSPASTIPSEPEAKGKAGAGPVGEAVAFITPNGLKYLRSGRDRKIEVVSYSQHHAVIPLYAHPVEEPGEVERDPLCCCSEVASRHTIESGHSFIDAHEHEIDLLERQREKARLAVVSYLVERDDACGFLHYYDTADAEREQSAIELVDAVADALSISREAETRDAERLARDGKEASR